MAFMNANGINGSTQVVKPTNKLLSVTKQNMETPQMKFMIVPIIIPTASRYLRFDCSFKANPITKAIIGNDKINPPVGPIMICQPPVKLENTGKPNAPNNM